MKKLFMLLAVAGVMVACNEEKKSEAEATAEGTAAEVEAVAEKSLADQIIENMNDQAKLDAIIMEASKTHSAAEIAAAYQEAYARTCGDMYEAG